LPIINWPLPKDRIENWKLAIALIPDTRHPSPNTLDGGLAPLLRAFGVKRRLLIVTKLTDHLA
jgi:hypothetical protein